MIAAMLAYALPFIIAALLFLLWAWSGYSLRFRFPRYYEFNLKVYDSFPKIAVYAVIALIIYFFITTESYYD